MSKFHKILHVVVFVLGLILIVMLLCSSMACQVGLSVDAQTYYPDEAGNGKVIGDPRKGRYGFGNTSASERVQSVESSSKFNTLPEKGGK